MLWKFIEHTLVVPLGISGTIRLPYKNSFHFSLRVSGCMALGINISVCESLAFQFITSWQYIEIIKTYQLFIVHHNKMLILLTYY